MDEPSNEQMITALQNARLLALFRFSRQFSRCIASGKIRASDMLSVALCVSLKAVAGQIGLLGKLL